MFRNFTGFCERRWLGNILYGWISIFLSNFRTYSRVHVRKNKNMDVFLMIRRKKLTIFTDAKDSTTIYELKKIIEGILKVPPHYQRLYSKDGIECGDEQTLQECGYTSSTAKAQSPATLGLALSSEDGDFEELETTPYSSPPDLPDVMKIPEPNGDQIPS